MLHELFGSDDWTSAVVFLALNLLTYLSSFSFRIVPAFGSSQSHVTGSWRVPGEQVQKGSNSPNDLLRFFFLRKAFINDEMFQSFCQNGKGYIGCS